MTTRLAFQLFFIFVASISTAVLPGMLETHGIVVATPGNTPNTLWIGSGPASDTLRLQYYTQIEAVETFPPRPEPPLTTLTMDTAATGEYDALGFGIPNSTPQIDLTDTPIPASQLTSPNLADSRFYVTPSIPAYDYTHVDFNLGNSFFGIEFCNGSDDVVAGYRCPNATYANPIVATCPGTVYLSGGLGDCSKAGVAVRQGISHLIDKTGFVANVLQNYGSVIDNILAPAQNILHSGQDYGPQTPCSTVGVQAAACSPQNRDIVGAYAVDPTLPIGSQQVWPSYLGGTYSGPACTTPLQIEGLAGSCYLAVGGACSWDILIGCGTFQGQTTLSANHLSGDGSATSYGMVPAGSPDFCAAAQDFVNAGLGTGVDTPANGCKILNFCANNGGGTSCFTTGTSGTPGGPLRLYAQQDPDLHALALGLGSSICELINGPTVISCSQVNLQIDKINFFIQSNVYSTGCRVVPEPNTTCTTQGPQRTWNIYLGKTRLSLAVDNLYASYNSQFSSDLCGGNKPSQMSVNEGLLCNTLNDLWSTYGQITSTPDIAIADTQVANDIFGNHTLMIPVASPLSQYAWLAGWQGVSNAMGTGIASGNIYGPLDAWNPQPAVPGPTIRWGQNGQPMSMNPFLFNSAVEGNVIQSIYDSLLASNPYNPASMYGWMVDSYQIVQNPGVPNPTAQIDGNCPLNVQTNTGTWGVGGCVKMVLRGDNSWQDIYNCPPTVSSCLASHSITAQDVKFTIENINATGGLLSGATANIVDVLYNPASLPSSAFSAFGGTQANSQPEILYFALKQLSAWGLIDIAGLPIVPQHIWETLNVTDPCLSPTLGSSTINDIYANTPACQVEPTYLSGPGSDPLANNRLIGSGAWICASGTIGATGTVYGGGCSTSNNDSPAAGDVVTLRRFQYQGTATSQQGSLNLNYAYFRTNGKLKNWEWADFLALGSGTNNGFGAHGVVAIQDIQSVASCLGLSAPAGTCTAAVFAHWSAPAATLSTVPAAGLNIGVVNGGALPVNNGVLAQVSRWYQIQWYDQQASTASLPAPLLYGVNGNQLIPGPFPAAGSGQQVLYEDGTNETS